MSPKIDPSWRTSTVTQLCLSMRQERDYAALPILADALQDAGCTDEELLAKLREGPKWRAQFAVDRLVCLVLGGEFAATIGVLDEIADALDLTYNALMFAARAWQNDEEYTTQYGGEHWRDTFPLYAEKFWAAWLVVTGETPKGAEWSAAPNFFSCSC